MENNKYYTPTIEEFHIGFEYEQQVGEYGFPTEESPWIKKTFYDLGILLCNPRVKYLDREDIESFGFELMDKELMDKYNLFRQIPSYILDGSKSNGNGLIILQHDLLNDKVNIKTPNYIRDASGRFDGYIIYINGLIVKNINEFRRNLKRLSII